MRPGSGAVAMGQWYQGGATMLSPDSCGHQQWQSQQHHHHHHHHQHLQQCCHDDPWLIDEDSSDSSALAFKQFQSECFQLRLTINTLLADASCRSWVCKTGADDIMILYQTFHHWSPPSQSWQLIKIRSTAVDDRWSAVLWDIDKQWVMLSTPGSLWPQPASSCDRFQTLDMLAQFNGHLWFKIAALSWLYSKVIMLLRVAIACKINDVDSFNNVSDGNLTKLPFITIYNLTGFNFKFENNFFVSSLFRASLYYIVLWSVKCCIIRQSHQHSVSSVGRVTQSTPVLHHWSLPATSLIISIISSQLHSYIREKDILLLQYFYQDHIISLKWIPKIN